MRDAYKILVGKMSRKRDHSEDLGKNGIIILKCIIKEIRLDY
jgi:hypothetical protein